MQRLYANGREIRVSGSDGSGDLKSANFKV